MIVPPVELTEKYAIVHDDGMFVRPASGPFWQKDPRFAARLRGRLSRLRFLQMDIFDSPDYFKPGSLDLIYMSDIFWSKTLVYYQTKLARMVKLLRPGGRIISYLDAGHDFWGRGVSPSRLLAQQAKALKLKIEEDALGYFVLQKTERDR
jgi:hypothetical protein